MGVLGAVVSGDLTVEFSVWGSLQINAGSDLDHENVKCTAYSDAPKGEFIWMIGDKTMDNANPIVPEDSGGISQIFKLKPYVSYDNKKLRCKYIERDSNGNLLSQKEDEITLRIFKIDLPTKINAGRYKKGEQVELSIEFQVFPKPDQESMFWVVRNMETDTTKRFDLGTTTNKIQVLELENLEDDRFRTTLIIENATDLDAKNSYAFHINHLNTENTVPIYFSVMDEYQDLQSGIDMDEVVEITTIEPELKNSEAELGIGLLVVLALILLILFICIGFCLYKQCCGKSTSPPTSPRISSYSAVKQKEQA